MVMGGVGGGGGHEPELQHANMENNIIEVERVGGVIEGGLNPMPVDPTPQDISNRNDRSPRAPLGEEREERGVTRASSSFGALGGIDDAVILGDARGGVRPTSAVIELFLPSFVLVSIQPPLNMHSPSLPILISEPAAKYG